MESLTAIITANAGSWEILNLKRMDYFSNIFRDT